MDSYSVNKMLKSLKEYNKMHLISMDTHMHTYLIQFNVDLNTNIAWEARI